MGAGGCQRWTGAVRAESTCNNKIDLEQLVVATPHTERFVGRLGSEVVVMDVEPHPAYVRAILSRAQLQ